MSLTCSCDFEGDWWYCPPNDYKRLNTKRWRKCCSCKCAIPVGDLCLEFDRWRPTRNDIEDRIYGGEVPLASYWMCEACGDLYFNLDELGFCIELPSNMRALVREYAEIYGRQTP